jgi:hypothetical protein
MSRYLDMVDEPLHVKKLTLEQLQQLAQEIRQELIAVLSKNGGHLGPNLGVVELTIALHYVFATPDDKFVWDVSHQSYVHKLLTGRKNRFHTIRTTGGLSGFAMRSESEHDCYGSGHSEAILSEDKASIERFLNEVDAACVYANASTRFTDGGQFGLGAEVGISTQKMHARGPMGLRELCSYKWIIFGSGQVRP